MAVRKFKPVTPGQRHKLISAFDDITSTVPEKSLLAPRKSSGGRNNQGKMTMRYPAAVTSVSTVSSTYGTRTSMPLR